LKKYRQLKACPPMSQIGTEETIDRGGGLIGLLGLSRLFRGHPGTAASLRGDTCRREHYKPRGYWLAGWYVPTLLASSRADMSIARPAIGAVLANGHHGHTSSLTVAVGFVLRLCRFLDQLCP
jgi:hypothetical protein